MSQDVSKNGVPPSVGANVSGIETLLNRNLPEVFGQGDPVRRRAAIQELYTEDCILCVPPGTFVGHVRRRSPKDASRLCLYAAWRTPGSAQFGTPSVGLGTERQNADVHRNGF